MILRPGDSEHPVSLPQVHYHSPSHGPQRFRSSGESGLGYAATKARELISSAEDQAQKIICEARVQIERERDDARKTGFEMGRAQAVECVYQAEYAAQRTLRCADKSILEIALTVAKEVVGIELRQAPESIIKRIERAMSRTLTEKRLTLAVHPSQEKRVLASIEDLAGTWQNAMRVKVKADPRIGIHDARLETESGAVEASIGSHLEAIEHRLFRSSGRLQSSD